MESLPLGLPIYGSLLNDLTIFPSTEQSLNQQLLCFSPLDHLIIRQHRSRPWGSFAFNWSYILNLFRVVRYQFLSDTEQILDLLEICILVYHQILCIHRSKMTAAFIDDDMNNPHISTLVFSVSIPNFDKFLCGSQLFQQILVNLSQVLMIWNFHVTKFCFSRIRKWIHISHLFPNAGWVWRFTSFPVSRNLHLDCHPVSSLENIRLDSGLCFVSVSRYW